MTLPVCLCYCIERETFTDLGCLDKENPTIRVIGISPDLDSRTGLSELQSIKNYLIFFYQTWLFVFFSSSLLQTDKKPCMNPNQHPFVSQAFASVPVPTTGFDPQPSSSSSPPFIFPQFSPVGPRPEASLSHPQQQHLQHLNMQQAFYQSSMLN